MDLRWLMEQIWNRPGVAYPNNIAGWRILPNGNLFKRKGRKIVEYFYGFYKIRK